MFAPAQQSHPLREMLLPWAVGVACGMLLDFSYWMSSYVVGCHGMLLDVMVFCWKSWYPIVRENAAGVGCHGMLLDVMLCCWMSCMLLDGMVHGLGFGTWIVSINMWLLHITLLRGMSVFSWGV